jgi:hypothetical protein
MSINKVMRILVVYFEIKMPNFVDIFELLFCVMIVITYFDVGIVIVARPDNLISKLTNNF